MLQLIHIDTAESYSINLNWSGVGAFEIFLI